MVNPTNPTCSLYNMSLFIKGEMLHMKCNDIKYFIILFAIPPVYYQYTMLKYLMSQYSRFFARCRNK